MATTFNAWEIQYLQDLAQRWYFYKGVGSFSGHEHELIASIKTKVQIPLSTAERTPVFFTAEEANLLKSLLYMGKQDYGRGSGGTVSEVGVRQQVSQRTVQINGAILAKLNNQKPPIVLQPEQSDGPLS